VDAGSWRSPLVPVLAAALGGSTFISQPVTARIAISSSATHSAIAFPHLGVSKRGINRWRPTTGGETWTGRVSTSSWNPLSVRSMDAAGLISAPKHSNTGPVPSKIAKFRAACFYLLTGALSLPLFVVMLVVAPFVLLTDYYRRAGEHFVNAFWAKASTAPLFHTEVSGIENLPGSREPCVYVANHQSYLDIYTLLASLPRPFKFVSKTSNFLIPIVGWSMFLTGHVGLDRMDRRSQIRLVNDCRRLLKNEAQVLLFPEGTRTTTWTESNENKTRYPVMGTFKKGAFTIAKKANVPIVPITLIGTGNLMPNGREGLMFPGSTKMVIHPPLRTDDKDANQLSKEAREAIASALPAGSY